MSQKILIVAAHPDDEILGCGGTAARLAQEGNEIYTMILGEGITARDFSRQQEKRAEEIAGLKQQIADANHIIGVHEVFIFDFPDNRFDSVPLLDIVKKIEEIKNKIKPDVLFTHYGSDLNIDHQITFQASLAATRPMTDETVKEVYAYEVLSSTEWAFPLSYSPDCFYDISTTIEIKVAAMEKYRTEIRDFPHPRSIDGIRLNAQYWGMRTGRKSVEAFKTIRMIR